MKKELNINEFLKQGFNKSQATSLAWAQVFEAKQIEVEYRYGGRVDGTIRIDTYCYDCKEGGQFIPDAVRYFINAHKDHKTRTIRIK